jgi:glucosamine kinase
VNALIPEVYGQAGIDMAETANTAAVFGMAGARLQSAQEEFARRAFPFGQLRVLDDIDIARAGALGGRDGAALIIGTGSAGLGIMQGVRHQVGGWGFHIGDTMSGAILGRELIRLSLLAHEGLTEGSPLTKAVMRRFNDDADALMSWSFQTKPVGYGEVVPLIFEFREKGDPIAEDLIRFELDAIDQYIRWFESRGAPAIAVTGGLGRRLTPLLRERYGALIVEPESEPLVGALILARQLFG